MITPEQLVNREVRYCVSFLVSTLAQAQHETSTYEAKPGHNESRVAIRALFDQAFELQCPIDDWEEAARQGGFKVLQYDKSRFAWVRGQDNGTFHTSAEAAWQDACEFDNLDPYQREVFEHWIVSDWLADKLEAHGEKVDKDFAGMTVWARTTSGQAIAADSVIEAICAELNAA